jgi:hypothetical protein
VSDKKIKKDIIDTIISTDKRVDLVNTILERKRKEMIVEKENEEYLKEIKILTVDRKREWIGNYKKNYYRNINKASTNVKIVKIFFINQIYYFKLLF